MAAILKFRRDSGVPELYISEPFWNESNTTLNVGIGDGAGEKSSNHITLVNLNEVNEGDLIIDGDITGVNADFGGAVNIDGNLFVGGTITLGDGDDIIVASPFSSSLIPSEPSTFDLGAPVKRWRNLYIDNIYISGSSYGLTLDYDNLYNVPALVSSSEQISHNGTSGVLAGEHINHNDIQIYTEDGLIGGSNIASSVTLRIDGTSSYFTGSVTDILDKLGVISGSGGYTDADTLDFINSQQVLSGSLDNRTIDGLTLTNVTASGSFSGSYVGDGSQLTGVVTGSGTFLPTVADSVTMPDDHGGILSGTTAGELKGNTYDELFSDIFFPTVIAYTQQLKSVSIPNIPTSTQEVGTNLKPTLSPTLNPGNIYNGDGTDGPALVGNALGYDYKLPGGATDYYKNATANTDTHTYTTDYNLIFGNNIWSVEVDHAAGTGAYYDNKAVAGTNLDGSRVATSISRNTNTIYGRRYAWSAYGTQNSEPTDSAGVRGLSSKRFLGGSNTGAFNITIPIGTQSVYFFIPAGRTVQINYIESSNANVTATFVETHFNVNDANGVAVSYDSWVTFIGNTGYPEVATYRVTIT